MNVGFLTPQVSVIPGRLRADPRSLKDRARTPERIAAIVPILKAGIDAEEHGLKKLRRAADMLG